MNIYKKLAGKSIREVLSDEYEKAKARNPRYSVRQFAKKLAVDHSLLSGFLKGKRKLSSKIQHGLLSQFAMNSIYVLFYESSSEDPLVIDFSPEDLDLLFDYRTAIITECFNLSHFPNTEAEIAKQTGIKIGHVKKTIQFLYDYNLIRREQDCWLNTHSQVKVMNAEINMKARSDIFLRATQELNQHITANLPVKNCVSIVALDPDSMNAIDAEFNKQQNKTIEAIDRLSKKKTALYQILIALHPINSVSE